MDSLCAWLQNIGMESSKNDQIQHFRLPYHTGNDIASLMSNPLLKLHKRYHGYTCTHWFIRSTGDEEIRYELEKYFTDPYFVPTHVDEFGDEEEDEPRFLAWIFMGAPGPGASLHVRYTSS